MRQYDGLDDRTRSRPRRAKFAISTTAPVRTSMTVAGQPKVSYAWDNANRPPGITQGSTSIPYNYDNANRRIT